MKDLGDFMASVRRQDGWTAAGRRHRRHHGDDSGGTAYFTANMTPGNYVMLCFVPDGRTETAVIMEW
jgi:hypothetical protein